MKNIIRFALVVVFALALPAAAQNMDWNMVGSAGNVDEASGGLFAFSGTNAHIRGGMAGNVVLRYPVTNTYGGAISKLPPWNTFEMAATDSGANGFVQARLIQVNQCSNVEVVLATIVSPDGDQGSACTTAAIAGIDFGQYIYYVEVTIARNNAAALASLQSLSLY
jgi:hypothetical protein